MNKSSLMHLIPKAVRPSIQNIRKKTLYRNFIIDTKVIYIHIPKAAGSSIAMSLYNTDKPGHYKAWEYRWENPKIYEQYYKFSVVRNPYTRISSAFSYLKSGGKSNRDLSWAKRHVFKYGDVNDFIENEILKSTVQNWVHFSPQYLFVCDEQERIIVDDIFKLEELEKYLETISERTGRNLTDMQLLNKSNKTSDLNDHSKTIINTIYSKDFRIFSYEK